MSRWAYYSPLWLGALLVLALNEPLRGAMNFSDAVEWLIVVGAALTFGIACQVLLTGVQGAFAQVLPVPGGRSLRGGPAMAAGWLLIAWFVLGAATTLFAFEPEVPRWVVVAGLVLTAACLLAALLIYAWNLPAADADFRGEEAR